MVKFSKDTFTIEVESKTNAAESWYETCCEIIEVLQSVDADLRQGNNYYYLLALLRDMLPNGRQIRSMGEKDRNQ